MSKRTLDTEASESELSAKKARIKSTSTLRASTNSDNVTDVHKTILSGISVIAGLTRAIGATSRSADNPGTEPDSSVNSKSDSGSGEDPGSGRESDSGSDFDSNAEGESGSESDSNAKHQSGSESGGDSDGEDHEEKTPVKAAPEDVGSTTQKLIRFKCGSCHKRFDAVEGPSRETIKKFRKKYNVILDGHDYRPASVWCGKCFNEFEDMAIMAREDMEQEFADFF